MMQPSVVASTFFHRSRRSGSRDDCVIGDIGEDPTSSVSNNSVDLLEAGGGGAFRARGPLGRGGP